MEQEKIPPAGDDPSGNDRREFLKKCGKYAAITPPAITMLLSTSLTSNAIAKSGGGKIRKSGGGGKPEWASGGSGQSASSNKGGKK